MTDEHSPVERLGELRAGSFASPEKRLRSVRNGVGLVSSEYKALRVCHLLRLDQLIEFFPVQVSQL